MKKPFTWVYFNEKFKALGKALKLQAKEYERRLTALNGEADRLHKMQEQYIPREVFERMIDQLGKDIKTLSEWKTKQEGRSQLLHYIPWLLTALSIALIYYKR